MAASIIMLSVGIAMIVILCAVLKTNHGSYSTPIHDQNLLEESQFNGDKQARECNEIPGAVDVPVFPCDLETDTVKDPLNSYCSVIDFPYRHQMNRPTSPKPTDSFF